MSGKKVIFCCFLFFSLGKAFAQNGLEKIYVEQYYVSNENDTLTNAFGGKLPVGSITYRIYADLLPNYTFQAAYGTAAHPLSITTSTQFFNNEEIGTTYPNKIPARSLAKNTVMLDSWLSVGAAGENYLGVPKDSDDTLGTIKHVEKVLLNAEGPSLVSLNEKDGLHLAPELPRPTFFGIDKEVLVFDNRSNGNTFQTTNGAWACMGKGAKGPDSLTTNRVLIAQITTDGEFNFELNLQIGTPDRGVSQNYVARNPVGNEIVLPSLIYQNIPKKRNSKKANKNKTI